jgi:glycosyltransferase involved in cell wall biosynthesis
MGQVSEAEKYAALQAADVFASTSQHEGFGLVFLEAMAQGLPIVCYDRGGQTDFLASGETGYVVPLNDEGGFKAALLALHADPDARRRHGTRNLERVEQFFIDTCATRYEQIFEDVIARRTAASARDRAISPS